MTNLKNLNNQMRCATMIQSWMRGVLTRLSDRCILTQLYLLLPPFWRTVLHSAPYEQDILNPIASSLEAMRRMLEGKKGTGDNHAKPFGPVFPHEQSDSFHAKDHSIAYCPGQNERQARG